MADTMTAPQSQQEQPQQQEGLADNMKAEGVAEGEQEQAQTTQDSIADNGQAAAGDGKNAQEQAQQSTQPPVADYELAVSEDFPMPKEQLSDFTACCRKAGLTKEQAEAVLGWHKSQYKEDTAWRAQQEQQIRASWDKAILEDKDFGGTVSNYKETVAAAKKALGTFDPTGELRQLLIDSQGQYHPAVVKALARVGRAMGEHKFISGSGTGKDIPLEDRMYPTM